MPFKSEKQRKWMWANEPEMAEKWEEEEQRENYIRVTEGDLRRIIRRTILSEQDVASAIKTLVDTLDDTQKEELIASMGTVTEPEGPVAPAEPEGAEEPEGDPADIITGDMDPSQMGALLDDPENQDAAVDAISADPAALTQLLGDNPDAIEGVIGKNPDMLQGFLDDPKISGALTDILKNSDMLKGMLSKFAPDAAAALGENTVRITRRQLRKIIKEGIDILNSETGELLIFEDDWETGGGDAPEAAARDLMKRLNITPLESSHTYDDDPNTEIIEVSPDDWALIDVEVRGKRHYRKNKRERERLDIDNLLARVDRWAADAGGDYGADNPGVDMQDVAWDLAASAEYEFKEDEWFELINHFDDEGSFHPEDDLITYIADRIAG